VLNQAPPLEALSRGRDIPQASLTSNEGCSKERELGRERRNSNRGEKEKEKGKKMGKEEQIRENLSSFLSFLLRVFLFLWFLFVCPFLIFYIQRRETIEQNETEI
jgi:hypothetical protein